VSVGGKKKTRGTNKKKKLIGEALPGKKTRSLVQLGGKGGFLYFGRSWKKRGEGVYKESGETGLLGGDSLRSGKWGTTSTKPKKIWEGDFQISGGGGACGED